MPFSRHTMDNHAQTHSHERQTATIVESFIGIGSLQPYRKSMTSRLALDPIGRRFRAAARCPHQIPFPPPNPLRRHVVEKCSKRRGIHTRDGHSANPTATVFCIHFKTHFNGKTPRRYNRLSLEPLPCAHVLHEISPSPPESRFRFFDFGSAGEKRESEAAASAGDTVEETAPSGAEATAGEGETPLFIV